MAGKELNFRIELVEVNNQKQWEVLYGSIWNLSFCLKKVGFPEDFYDTIWTAVRFYGQ